MWWTVNLVILPKDDDYTVDLEDVTAEPAQVIINKQAWITHCLSYAMLHEWKRSNIRPHSIFISLVGYVIFSSCGTAIAKSSSTILCEMDSTVSNGGGGVVRFPLSSTGEETIIDQTETSLSTLFGIMD